MNPIPLPFSRTSSTTSLSSDDTQDTSTARRTRRRFSSAQLIMLEQLFHQNSHPTRSEREALAREGGMEIKSVTIWFQNKRQTERRVALHSASNHHSIPARRSLPSVKTPSLRSARPSLDHVASRSELRAPPPYTPSRRRESSVNVWDNMPSSPIGPPTSPPAREYVEFGKMQRVRTLEWACAAARLAEKDGTRNRHSERYDGDDTDDESHEAVTPKSSLAGEDQRWTLGSGVSAKLSHGPEDEDIMRAALALCGLGRRC